jgi:Mg2+/Co2+ transporter CorC
MEKKMTKREYFAELINIVADSECDNREDILAFIEHEIALLNKKSSSRTPNKVQVENENIKDTIKSVLVEIGRPATITELISNEALATYTIGEDVKTMTNQKLSALVNQLVKTGEVVKVIDKKKSYFSMSERV